MGIMLLFQLLGIIKTAADIMGIHFTVICKVFHTVAHNHIAIMGYCSFHHFLIHFRLEPVVAVHKGDIVTGSRFQADISGSGHASVLFMDDFHPGICLRKPVAHFRATVRRTVIHQD